MMASHIESSRTTCWPAWWRWTVVALSTLVLCSCRAAIEHPAGATAEQPPAASPAVLGGSQVMASSYSAPLVQHGPTMAPPMAMHSVMPGAIPATPLPETVIGSWSPPGLARPWPEDEYLRDGGDRRLPVHVTPDWFVEGLEPEDTIAHFDTLDGRTHVEPSNRVHIYSPRFVAVRSVSATKEDRGIEVTRGVDRPVGAVRYDLSQLAVSSQQHIQAIPEVGSSRSSAYRMRQGNGLLSTALSPINFSNQFLPFENLTLMQRGLYEHADKPLLSEGIQAAIAWSHDAGVQVILDKQRATEAVGDRRVEAVWTVDDSRGPARLRVVKVASTSTARPGEVVDFTIRFDNLGDQLIGNVTIIDNLTQRLEYVPDSAQASLEADFSTQPTEGGAMALRWEVIDPIKPGDGGIVRFQGRVR